MGFLVRRGFEETEVLYLKDACAVFLSLKPRDILPDFYLCNGNRRQVTFKALNSLAKEQAKAVSTQSQASQPASSANATMTRSAKQQAFFQQVRPKASKAPPATSPAKTTTKRAAGDKTGMTPDGKAQKEI